MRRKSYTADFKREAVRLANESGNLSRTARDLDIRPDMLRKWRDALGAHGEQAFPGHGSPRDADLARLQRENARLREELTILKKAVGTAVDRRRISSRPL
ncbi:MAG TPA: transposase [Rhodothermales bacterium]|nr:transposase [Rhodothermales bacterium]